MPSWLLKISHTSTVVSLLALISTGLVQTPLNSKGEGVQAKLWNLSLRPGTIMSAKRSASAPNATNRAMQLSSSIWVIKIKRYQT